MKILLSTFLLTILVLTRVHAAPGDLDTTFGNGGIAIIGSSTESLGGDFVALQSDGKIVVAGSTGCDLCSVSHIVVARFFPNGSVDTAFGDGGEVIISFEDVTVAVGLSAQSDRTIVVAGSSHPPAIRGPAPY